MYKEFKIKNRLVGKDYEPLIIAEIGINHNGSLEVAIEMADAAIESGAEIIKHQTHIVDDEMSEEAKSIIPDNADIPIYEIMQKCSLCEDDEYKLMQHINSKNCIFISTPFSKEAVDRLIKFDVPCFKIGSGECTNYPLIEYVSSFKKPMIISTGMNKIEDIFKTVKIVESNSIPYALLHCTNVYPTPPNLVRLGAIQKLEKCFPNAVIGLSDHTINNFTSLGGIALGCSIIERHFTDKKSRPGPDIICSMDKEELKELILGAKTIFEARGDHKGPILEENKTIEFAFHSVVAIEEIKKGEEFNKNNIWLKRPGNGEFKASDFNNLLGKKASNKILKGSQIRKVDVI
ncbi:N-acetylneuraminate synthase family protein [Acinetobacter sp.]|uniref:N-acetylneuraminate synthase family protein n=1 Tax=Acinetobacter sp. TaxID=472 RepID=UPI000C64E430|nr:N-acetylneuraminate synthase family protein [Acinetobacter sp.]MBC70006.1 polyhydroxyalkanoate biosynthesis repressor PhaR [Acinetobacter sp.]